MSRSTVFAPIVACLLKAEENIGLNRVWHGVNTLQDLFVGDYFDMCKAGIIGLEDAIQSIFSFSADEINRFLAEKGFSIQLDPLEDNEFGVASVLDILLSWQSPGKKCLIQSSGQSFDGVELKGGVDFCSSRNFPTVVKIRTQSKDCLYLAIPDCEPDGDVEMMSYAKELMTTRFFGSAYDGVRFPMVNYDQVVDISWLLGLRTNASNGDEVYISQAHQQSKLRINEFGARAESAVALGVTRGICMNSFYTIDKPFMAVIVRDGVPCPVFVAYVTPEDWKNPGSLT